MFQELEPILAGRSLTLRITDLKSEGRYKVTVQPIQLDTDKDSKKPLLMPCSLEGTAELLDRDFPQQLKAYVAKYQSVEESIETVEAEMDAALAEVKAEAKKKVEEEKKKNASTSSKSAKVPLAGKKKDDAKPEPPKSESPKPTGLFDAADGEDEGNDSADDTSDVVQTVAATPAPVLNPAPTPVTKEPAAPATAASVATPTETNNASTTSKTSTEDDILWEVFNNDGTQNPAVAA